MHGERIDVVQPGERFVLRANVGPLWPWSLVRQPERFPTEDSSRART